MEDSDKAALLALLTRYIVFWNARDADMKLEAEVKERLVAHAQNHKNFQAAFSIFGYTTDKGSWERLKNEAGAEAYTKAIRAGEALSKVQAIKSASEPHKSEENVETNLVPTHGSETPTVREGVLARLKAIHPKGSKAGELRTFMEETYAMELHEKTVGMTLYRLSQDQKVRRDGRTWFFVPPVADTKNPAGDTAGPETSQT